MGHLKWLPVMNSVSLCLPVSGHPILESETWSKVTLATDALIFVSH